MFTKNYFCVYNFMCIKSEIYCTENMFDKMCIKKYKLWLTREAVYVSTKH